MQRLNKTQKVDFFQIPNFDINLMKLSLESNGKTPCQEWKTLNAPIKSLVYDNCNVGLITGIRNMITVVDLDFKDIPYDDHAFIEKFGNKFMKHFDTFTVKTQSGGYHLYFKYDAEIKQTQNKALGVDIRNDGGYVVCPPSSINGKQYVIKIMSLLNLSQVTSKNGFYQIYIKLHQNQKNQSKTNMNKKINLQKLHMTLL